MGNVAKFLFMPVGLGGLGIDFTKKSNNNPVTPTQQQTKVAQTEAQTTQTTNTRRGSALDKNTEDFNINASYDDTTVKKKTLLGS